MLSGNSATRKNLLAATFCLLAACRPSGTTETVKADSPRTRGTAVEQKASVASIRIAPGDVTVRAGQKTYFAAIAFDATGGPVIGVAFTWSATDEAGAPVPMREDGVFASERLGEFRVTADAAGQHTSVMVTVVDQLAGMLDGEPPPPPPGWDADNIDEAFTPRNALGRPWRARPPRVGGRPVAPHQMIPPEVGNSNFELNVPVVTVPGRGLPLSLSFHYNSRLWTRFDSDRPELRSIWYNIDRNGWPAPGWSFPFVRLVNTNGDAMLVEPDGTRRPYGPSHVTTDGSYISYDFHIDPRRYWVILDAEARYPNGTVVTFGLDGYPVRITDANGNYITITYVAGVIDTITDTLNRPYIFHYYQNGLSIEGPDQFGGFRTLVRFHFRRAPLSYGFSGYAAAVQPEDGPPLYVGPLVIDAIYYPATNTGYWFGDDDSYSSYGMLAKVMEQRGMSFNADTGAINQGIMTRQWKYNYPLRRDDSLTDAPSYTRMEESWEGMTGGPAVTQFWRDLDSSPRQSKVTYPNGTLEQDSFKNPGQWDDGLVSEERFFDSSNTLLRRTVNHWIQDIYGFPVRDSVTTYDLESGETLTALYSGWVNSRPGSIAYRIENGQPTVLRHIDFTYQNGTDAYILNLLKKVEVFSGASGPRVSAIEYAYDTEPLTNTPGVLQHADRGTSRGNVTQITRYADPQNLAGAVAETHRYDVAGNLLTQTSCKDPLREQTCTQTRNTYTLDTQFAYRTSQRRGALDGAPSATINTSASYDIRTGLMLSATDANGQATQMDYFPGSLRLRLVTLPTGATTSYEYNDRDMYVTATTRSVGGALAGQKVERTNGRGQLRRQEAWAAGPWDIAEMKYDVMGRLLQQSRPFREPIDERDKKWTTQDYDDSGRIRRIVAPDGSETARYYNDKNPDGSPKRPPGASTNTGHTVRTRDAWGRERWSLSDILGRLVEVAEPNPSGSGSVFDSGPLFTDYAYDDLDRLTDVSQGQQHRRFRYDGLSRRTHQKLAEKKATLNDLGVYVGNGSWSDVFAFDERSNLTSHTDARGVKQNFHYNDDPLDRLWVIDYDTSGFGDVAYPILLAPPVSFDYMPLGNTLRPRRVTTSGVNNEEYGYDAYGRLNSKVMTMDGRQGYAYEIGYAQDDLSRLTDVRYPKEWGMPNEDSSRKLIHRDFDSADRLTALKVNDINYAWQFAYNSARQVTSMFVGTGSQGQLQEVYAYEPDSGLLSNQRVLREGSPLLNFSYDYVGPLNARTGQLVHGLDNLRPDRDKNYSYDALGRLIQVSSGRASPPFWTVDYAYDAYGNRTSVSSRGYTPDSDSGSTGGFADGSELNGPLQDGAAFVSQEFTWNAAPGLMFVGVPTAVTVTMTNTGTRDWNTSTHWLRSQNPPGNTIWGASQMRMEETTVRPGELAHFHLSAVAQTESDYNFQWQMFEAGVGYFGEMTPNVRIQVIPYGPLPPTDLRATAASASEIRLRWTRNSTDETGFEIERKEGAIGLYSQVGGAPSGATTYIDTDPELRPGTRYYYRVRAVYSGERRSPFCIEAGASTFGPPPTDGHPSLAYDANSNRISTAGFEYDATGNQTRALRGDGTWQRYQYDAAGHLVKVKDNAGQTIELYSYDAANRRVRTQLGDSSNLRTYYVWDSTSVVAEFVETEASPNVPSWARSYIYLDGRLLATVMREENQERVRYHHADRLGTRLITNPEDPAYFEQATLPFGGALRAESNITTNRPFTTYERSQRTGLDYAFHRHYDSLQGRFAQVDPRGMGAVNLGNPQSLNLYAYVNNNPVNATDPLGLDGCSTSDEPDECEFKNESGGGAGGVYQGIPGSPFESGSIARNGIDATYIFGTGNVAYSGGSGGYWGWGPVRNHGNEMIRSDADGQLHPTSPDARWRDLEWVPFESLGLSLSLQPAGANNGGDNGSLALITLQSRFWKPLFDLARLIVSWGTGSTIKNPVEFWKPPAWVRMIEKTPGGFGRGPPTLEPNLDPRFWTWVNPEWFIHLKNFFIFVLPSPYFSNPPGSDRWCRPGDCHL